MPCIDFRSKKCNALADVVERFQLGLFLLLIIVQVIYRFLVHAPDITARALAHSILHACQCIEHGARGPSIFVAVVTECIVDMCNGPHD